MSHCCRTYDGVRAPCEAERPTVLFKLLLQVERCDLKEEGSVTRREGPLIQRGAIMDTALRDEGKWQWVGGGHRELICTEISKKQDTNKAGFT